MSESPHVSGIIEQIVAEDGCNFIIRSLDEYPTPGGVARSNAGEVTFDEVIAIAASAGEVAVGWSVLGAGSFGPWEMNPKDKSTPRPWPADARVVALKHACPP